MSKKTLFFLLLALFVIGIGSFSWLQDSTVLINRAEATRRDFSVSNSYLFVTPLRAKANNDEKIRITVFVLNSQGLGVPGKNVKIGLDPALNIQVVQGITDDYGKAVYDVKAEKAGEYYLEVTIEGKKLPQQARLSYY